MKAKSIKKLLTAVLAASMLMGSILTVSASDASGSTACTPGTGAGVVTEENTETDESSPAQVAAKVPANGKVSLAGMTVTNTIAGSFLIKNFQGAAVITPLAQVKAGLGLRDGQAPHISAFDTDVKKSHLAIDCANAAATVLGGNVVSAVNVTLNAKENGKWITLGDGSVAMMLGLPKTADPSKTYYVVRIQAGGIVTILKDLDESPATVTFEVKTGTGTYAVIAV